MRLRACCNTRSAPKYPLFVRGRTQKWARFLKRRDNYVVDVFRLPEFQGPADIGDLLFTGWVQRFAQERLSISQHGTGGAPDGGSLFNFGDPSSSSFALERSNNGNWTLKSVQNIDVSAISSIVSDAIERFSAGDVGGDVVYLATMTSRAFAMGPLDMSNFMRRLGDQKWIAGRRRLGDSVLLEFTPEAAADSNQPQLFVPETAITVTMFVGGPIAGGLTNRVASVMIEIVGAICAFALGNCVDIPLVIRPASAEDAAAIQELRRDPSIPGLARDGVSLDIFGELAAIGGLVAFGRARGAFLSFHAALEQHSPDVATMLFVSSMEALITPFQSWKKEKATKRFIEAINELCPDAIDAVVNHDNVEQAFSFRRSGSAQQSRRRLLDSIYDTRSVPTHSGIGLKGSSGMAMFADSGSIRIALLSDLARGAILNFLQAPRSSLIGCPSFAQQSDTGDLTRDGAIDH